MSGPTGMMDDPQALRCLLYMVVSKYGGDITVQIPPEILAATGEVDMGTLVVDEADGPNIRIYIQSPEKLDG